jgi:hypothetical protein
VNHIILFVLSGERALFVFLKIVIECDL